MALAAYIALTDALVRDDTGVVSEAQRNDAIALAVLRYSQDRPRDAGGAHVLDTAEDTIPEEHREAVCAWAAALLLDQLAARAAGASEPTIAADGVDRQSQADRYRRLAQAYRERYFQALGLDPRRRLAAGTAVRAGAHAQGVRLTH